jgi:hypothetical protein
MKKIYAMGFLFCALSASAMAAGVDIESKFFTKQKVYSEDTYAMSDYLEFSVFDMSKLNLFINSKKIELKPQTPEKPITDTRTGAVEEPLVPMSTAEKEIRAILPEIPKSFYKNLKKQLLLSKVPVTLYASHAPAYARPIKLYIKLKKVSLGASHAGRKGEILQPVSIKIYGQLKDKLADKLLTRFYDEESTEYVVESNQAVQAFEALSDKMMTDLVQFLKTKY